MPPMKVAFPFAAYLGVQFCAAVDDLLELRISSAEQYPVIIWVGDLAGRLPQERMSFSGSLCPAITHNVLIAPMIFGLRTRLRLVGYLSTGRY